VAEKFKVTEEEAVACIPLLVEDTIMLPYQQAAQMRNVKSYADAETVLWQLVGLEKTSYADFTTRKFKVGEESVRAFFYGLQGMAAKLALPTDMIKAQFLCGLPVDLGKRVRPFVAPDDEEERIVSLVERLIKEDEKVSLVQSPSKEENGEITVVLHAVKQLSEEVAAMRLQVDTQARYRCFQCGKPGHMAKNCPSTRHKRTHQFSSRDDKWSKNGTGPVFRPAEY
jgi:hypothetical protein